jgi:hypothetical protein
MRYFLISLTALAFVGSSAPTIAAQCRDAKGKFIKCPDKPTRCKDAHGKFAKCGTKGAKPI